MIQIKKSKKGTLSEFIIRPNPSMPWRVIKKIYFFFSIFILIISLVLCYFGLYLAIPFYGIEVLLLGYALYFTCLKSTFYQIIRISSQGKNTRIGDFLCESERLELFKKIS